jgi:hypothetical protein
MEVRMSKPWWQSKVLWTNIALLVIAAVDIIRSAELSIPPQVTVWLVVAGAIINAALRIWSTSQPISGGPADKTPR